LSPCRTSSSSRMSKLPNLTPCSCRITTIWREKPHFSAPGEPFMKTMMGSLLIRASSLDSRVSTFGAGAAAFCAQPPPPHPPPPQPPPPPPPHGPFAQAGAAVASNWVIFAEISGAFAPIRVSVKRVPSRNTKAGTELTPYFSARSSAASASMLMNTALEHCSERRAKICSVCVHIGAHDAQK